MKYRWAVYTKLGVLITRCMARTKAKEIANKWNGSFKQEFFDSENQEKYRDYYAR
jgi:hypothetical protein